jgi:hypothetical protein
MNVGSREAGRRRENRPREAHRLSPRGELRHDILIGVLALASVAIGIEQLAREAPTPRFEPLDAVDLAIALFFIADFAWRAWREGPGRYLRSHWWELPALLPVSPALVASLPGLAVVRGVRLVRLARVLRLVRLLGVASRLRSVSRYTWRVAHRARVPTILGAGALVVWMGALVAWMLESDVNARLASAGGALWWSLNMFTNVAYVDFQPATTGGRVLAGVLELSGIAFIGVFTASLASAIVKEPTPAQEDAERIA